MKYYRVLPMADQMPRPDGSVYIHGELYTKKEVLRIGLNFQYMEEVSISSKRIYWSFGARFECKK